MGIRIASIWRLIASLVVGALVLGAGPASATLPDGRGYEMVSPPDKSGNDAISGAPALGIAQRTWVSDGNSIAYSAVGGFGDAGQGAGGVFSATRDVAAWRAGVLTLPFLPDTVPNVGSGHATYGVSEDNTRILLGSSVSDRIIPEGPAGIRRVIALHDLTDGSSTWISKPATATPVMPMQVIAQGASPDFSRIYFQANPANRITDTTKLVDEDATRVAGSGLYEHFDGKLSAVGVLPNGEIPTHGAVAPGGIGPGAAAGSISHAGFNNQVSRDGRRIWFLSPDPQTSSPVSPTHLYVRIDGERTVLASRSEVTGDPNVATATFGHASPDGGKVWFTSADQLTTDAPVDASPKVYEFDVESEDLTYLADTGVPLITSVDGSRFIYFRPSTTELWLDDDGARSEIAAPVVINPLLKMVRATSSGSRFFFATNAAIGGFNNAGGFNQVYVYDVDAAELSCVTCPPDGVAPAGNVTWVVGQALAPRWDANNAITDDGTRTYFDTLDRLLPSDLNDSRDVYEWHDGQINLISSGTAALDSMILNNSFSGDDVFIGVPDRLTLADSDGNYDIYDARVGGGLPFDMPPPVCADYCQGPPSSPPPRPSPASATLRGRGDFAAGVRGRFAKARVGVVQRRRLARTGSAFARVRVNRAGVVSVRLRIRLRRRFVTVSNASRNVGRAGTTKVALRLPASARRRLRARGALAARLVTSFSQAPGTQVTSMRLKRSSGKAG